MNNFSLPNQCLQLIIEQFLDDTPVSEVKPLGRGLINDTYLVSSGGLDSKKYVLQRINDKVFTDVASLQYNIDTVTRHIRQKLVAEGVNDIDRHVLRFLPVSSIGKTFYRSESGNCWRMSVYIERSVTKTSITAHSALDSGKAFGNFEAMLTDLSEPLAETIPGFHDMELRGRQLQGAIDKDLKGRADEAADIIAELQSHMKDMCRAEELYRAGLLPKRACHCDSKVDNVLYDADDGSVLCVIDLDTVMPSYVFSDFGDFLRSAASTVAEDDPNIDAVDFKEDIFHAFADGYLSAATFLTPVEKKNLAWSVALFPFMQCSRFIADYLNGDTYYKIKYPAHNLVRARNQLALYHKIMDKYDMLDEYIRNQG